MTIDKRIKGTVFPIPAFFNEDESFDIDSTKKYVEFLINNNAKTLMITVGTSRFNLLTEDEMKLMNKTVVESAKGKAATIVTGPILGSTKVSIDFAKHAEEIGADYVLMVYPERFYDEDSIYNYFEEICNSVNIGVMLHEANLKKGKGGDYMYSVELLKRLSNIKNFAGIKEECMNPDHEKEIYENLVNDTNIVSGGGGMGKYLKLYDKGCRSYLAGIGNFIPEKEHEFYDLVEKGETEKAKEIILEFESPFFKLHSDVIGWHPLLKQCMALMGLCKEQERKPLVKPSKEQKDQIAKVMKDLKLIE